MATRTISTRLVLEGEAEYRAQLKNVNAELSLQRSELAKVESQYRSSANSMEALKAKGTALQSMYDAQQTKLNLYVSRLEAARTAEASYAKEVETARSNLAEYQARLTELQKTAGNTAEEEAKLAEQIKAETEAMETAEAMQQTAANSVTHYQRQVNQAQVSLDDLNEELAQNQRYLDEAAQSADGCATSIDRYGKSTEQTKNAVDTLAAALAASGTAKTLQEIAQAIWACIDASTEFESAVTGVYKTVEGTPEQLAEISDGIKEMATELPTTTTEIAAVAESAGQLGIATENVLAFTRVMIDLGESTNLTAEEAATSLARFANITGTSAADYERLGSVIVGLGNNFASTESDITNMATNLASAGTLAGLTEAEIMALAAAMSSVGIEAAAGGTAMTQTLTAIEQAVASGGDTLEEFAQIAGMSAADFSAAWENDAITALQAFITGLGELDEQGESATLVLEDLGLSGVRQSNMLKSLALASDTLTGAVSLANQAWAENTALAEEANKRYETTESKLTMVSNAANNVKIAIGDALSPALGELAEAGTDAFSWAADFVEENPWLVQAITGVAAALTVLVGATTALMTIQKLIPIIQAFNAALAANPAILVASAIAGLVVTVGTFVASIDDTTVSVKELTQASEEMQETMGAARTAYEETASNTLATAEAAQAYIDKLEELENQQMLTDEQAQEYSNTVALLVNLLPELSQYVQESADGFGRVTFSLTESTSALRDYVDAYEQAAMQAAQEEVLEQYRTAYNAAYTEMYTNQVELAKVTATVTELEAQRADVLARVEELQAKSSLTQQELDELYQLNTVTLADLNTELAAAYEQQQLYTDAVDASTPLLEEAKQELEETEEAMQELTGATEDNTAAQEDNSESVGESIGSWEDLQSAMEDATDATRTLADAEDTLSSALQEQTENGTLSLNTALDLIDAGYAAALAIDTETGAITLNKDAYIAITQAKLEEQIATLESEKNRVDAALALKDEALMATELAKSYYMAADAKEAMDAADVKDALNAQSSSYGAQIAALEALKSSLNSYTFTYTSTVRTTSTASQQVKTQAEKDLETYKELKATLDHEKAMDLVSEEEYYAKLKEYRDQYLTDDDNLDEYQYNGGWKTGDNGLTMQWDLVDIVGLVSGRQYLPPDTLPTTLDGWIASIVAQLGSNFAGRYHVDPDYADTPLTAQRADVTGRSCGEILRMACMAAGVFPRADDETGDLTAEPLWSQGSKLTLDNMETYPVMKANDDLAVLIFTLYDGSDNGTEYTVSGNATSSGNTVAVQNPFIHNQAQALTAARLILSTYGGNQLETIGRGDPASELGDVDVVWLNESSATTGRRMVQTFDLSSGVLKGCQSTLLQADGSFLFENREVITEPGTWTAPAGATRLRAILVGKGSDGGHGEPGTMGRDSGDIWSTSGSYGANGADGSGAKVWAGTFDINPQQQFQVAFTGMDTLFGQYSSANGEVYPNGYSDVASGESYARTGVADPKPGSGDGGKGGDGGTPGYSHEEHYFIYDSEGNTVGGGVRTVIDVEVGSGSPGVPGAQGCVVVYWDKDEAE